MSPPQVPRELVIVSKNSESDNWCWSRLNHVRIKIGCPRSRELDWKDSTITIVPHFFVRDVEQSLDFYCELLGFQLDWHDVRDGREQALISWFDTSILFSADELPGRKLTGEIYFFVGDVDELYKEIREDVFVLNPPTVRGGLKEFRFRDCNGYDLVFAKLEEEWSGNRAPRHHFSKFGNFLYSNDEV